MPVYYEMLWCILKWLLFGDCVWVLWYAPPERINKDKSSIGGLAKYKPNNAMYIGSSRECACVWVFSKKNKPQHNILQGWSIQAIQHLDIRIIKTEKPIIRSINTNKLNNLSNIQYKIELI